MSASGPELVALATAYGVHTSYTDVQGVTQRPADDVLVALLQGMGAPLRDQADAAAALREERLTSVRRQLEPVHVHRLSAPIPVNVTLPWGTDPQDLWVTLELEDGTTGRSRLAEVVAATGEDGVVEGFRYVRQAIDLDAMAAGPLPPGYHRLVLEGEGLATSALVLAAPRCPTPERSWAAFLPLHALRSEHDWGTGSYTELGRLGQWIAERGAGFLGTLPLYPAFLDDDAADPSPYLPVSRLAYNELFVDPTVLPELAATPEARQLLESDNFRGRLSAVHASRFVDYTEVARLRRQVLEPMAQTVCGGKLPDRLAQLNRFAEARPELAAYARFRATREQGRPDCTSDAPAGDPGDYYLYCQWVAEQQLSSAGAAVGLYADLPIGSHPDGFDPCWSPHSFMSDVQGGAPPDRFFSEGQVWGFRPLHPRRMREDGYGFFIAALERAFRHAECLRIDHVMGLERLYMIPDGFSAREGTYVSYAADELHALVCIEADRAAAVVVGEDLGTVPQSVRRRMARDGMLRTWVFQFESISAEPLPEPPRCVVAACETHDLPTFAGYLAGDDIEERALAGVLSPDEAAEARRDRDEWRSGLLAKLGVESSHDEAAVRSEAFMGCLAQLARSEADLVLVDLEDVWGEREPHNRPGCGPEGGNWMRRSARTLEEIGSDPAVAAVCRLFGPSGSAR